MAYVLDSAWDKKICDKCGSEMYVGCRVGEHLICADCEDLIHNEEAVKSFMKANPNAVAEFVEEIILSGLTRSKADDIREAFIEFWNPYYDEWAMKNL